MKQKSGIKNQKTFPELKKGGIKNQKTFLELKKGGIENQITFSVIKKIIKRIRKLFFREKRWSKE